MLQVREGCRHFVVDTLCHVSDQEIEFLLQSLKPVEEGVDHLADFGAACLGLLDQRADIEPSDDAFDLCLDGQDTALDLLNPNLDLLQGAGDLAGNLLGAALCCGRRPLQILLNLLRHAPNLIDGRCDGVQHLAGTPTKGIDGGLHEDGIRCIQIEDTRERLAQLSDVIGKQKLQRRARLPERTQVGQQRRFCLLCQRADQFMLPLPQQFDLVEQQAVAGGQAAAVAVGILRLLAERDRPLDGHQRQAFVQPLDLL